MTVSLLLNRPRWADMVENEISICALLLGSLLILFYHWLHTSYSVSAQGCAEIENIFTSCGDSLASVRGKLWFI